MRENRLYGSEEEAKKPPYPYQGPRQWFFGLLRRKGSSQ